MSRRKIAGWLKHFANPPAEYRAVPFWSWNEVMEPAEIRRQVKLMKAAGWGGAFIHSRSGLITPYMGTEWFKAVDATLAACEAEGMLAWLYDEDKWPSGFAGGAVPLANPAFRMKVLLARKVGQSAPEGGEPLGAPVDGLQVYKWVAPLGMPWFNGTCYADLGDAAAMRKFLDEAYEPYFRRYKKYYGRLITAEFTDEPAAIYLGRIPAGSVPFSTNLLTRFQAMHGYDPLPKLSLLFRNGPGAERFRIHYYRAQNDLFENSFSRQLGEWCAARGIALTGHYMCEHNLPAAQLNGTRIMPNYRHMGIPGIDHLAYQIDEILTGKQCASVVNQCGKRRMLSELYGTSGQQLSFADRLWIGLQQIALGVNLLTPHLSLYTMAGCRKRDYPPNLFYQQPWWPLNRQLDEPLARWCVALSQGRYVAEALVLHPHESMFALWRARGENLPAAESVAMQGWDRSLADAELGAAHRLDNAFQKVLRTLIGDRIGFDLGDEKILAEQGRVVRAGKQPLLRVGRMEYPLVIIPGMLTLAPATFRLLQKFQAAGGRILRTAATPVRLDGEISTELTAWLKSIPRVRLADLAGRMARHAPPAVRLTRARSGNLRRAWTHARDLPDGRRLVALFNLDRFKALRATLELAGPWKSARRLDPIAGTSAPAEFTAARSGLALPLQLAPVEAALFLLQKSAAPAAAKAKSVRRGTRIPSSAWRVERLDDNALTLDYAAWREGDGAGSDRPFPVIEIADRLNAMKYDGPLTLQYAFTVRGLAPTRRARVVVEHPERYVIRVNGMEIRDTGLPDWIDPRFRPLEATGLLREGPNVIELCCANFQHGDLNLTKDFFGRYGTEIEAIYLVGDFAVDGILLPDKPRPADWKKCGAPPFPVRCYAQDSLVVSEPRPLQPGDVTSQGLPFYAGRLALRCKPSALRPTAKGECRLRLGDFQAAVAGIEWDGSPVGAIYGPYREVILPSSPDGKPGELTVILYGTLRNLLGPHHRVEGDCAWTGPENFRSNHVNHDGRVAENILAWANGRFHPNDWNDRYCIHSFGGLKKAEWVE